MHHLAVHTSNQALCQRRHKTYDAAMAGATGAATARHCGGGGRAAGAAQTLEPALQAWRAMVLTALPAAAPAEPAPLWECLLLHGVQKQMQF